MADSDEDLDFQSADEGGDNDDKLKQNSSAAREANTRSEALKDETGPTALPLKEAGRTPEQEKRADPEKKLTSQLNTKSQVKTKQQLQKGKKGKHGKKQPAKKDCREGKSTEFGDDAEETETPDEQNESEVKLEVSKEDPASAGTQDASDSFSIRSSTATAAPDATKSQHQQKWEPVDVVGNKNLSNTKDVGENDSKEREEQQQQPPSKVKENNKATETKEEKTTEKPSIEPAEIKQEQRDEEEVTKSKCEEEQKETATKHTAQEESVLEKLAKAGEQRSGGGGGWGSWGSWGKGLISTAANSVSTFAGQVTEGVHTVVETFESSIGAPPAEELASGGDKSEDLADRESPVPKAVPEQDVGNAPKSVHDADELKEPEEEDEEEAKASHEQPDWINAWSSTLQSKTKSLVESGLDVLETIGKKTMDSIKESDPGYTKTKGLFRGNKPNLSQLLREAKEETELRAASGDNSGERKLVSYSTLFDQHQGLAHLEALEMLAVTCTNKLTNLDHSEENIMQQVNELADLFSKVHVEDEDSVDEQDYPAGIEAAFAKISLNVKKNKLLESQYNARKWLENTKSQQAEGERIDGYDIHRQAIDDFSRLTAATMELYHKSCELLVLVPERDGVLNVQTVSEGFSDILRLVSNELTTLSQQYNDCLNTAADDSEDPDSINPMITDVFLEASNSTSYLRDGFKLLLPVLQQCVIHNNKQTTLAASNKGSDDEDDLK